MRLRLTTPLLLILLSVAAFGQESIPIPATELSKRVPMTTIFYSNIPDSAKTPDFLFARYNDTFSAEGRDKAGKPWRVILDPTIRGLWRADRDGHQTYYFAGDTGGVGMAPLTWILVLSFDEHGRPVPFYFRTQLEEYDERGLRDYLNLDGTGPVLLQQDWVLKEFTPDGVRSGYFITSVYEQRGYYWYRADGQHGTKVFPIFQSFEPPYKRAQEITDTASLKHWASDYGNDPKMGLRTHIVSVDRKGIHFGPELKCVMEEWEIFVRDTASGREIANDDSKPQELLAELARIHAPVVLTGLKEWPEDNSCEASVIWVTEIQ